MKRQRQAEGGGRSKYSAPPPGASAPAAGPPGGRRSPQPRPPEARQGRERLAVLVGEVLGDCRRGFGIALEELAACCGLSRQGLEKIEKQGVPDSLVRLALAMGCRPSEILSEAERRLAAEQARAAAARRRAQRAELGLVSSRDARAR